MWRRYPLSRNFLGNLAWFLAALVMGFFVWFLAITQSDPIGEISFQVNVQIQPDEGLLITNNPIRNSRTWVDVRAQQSVLGVLTEDDIIVRANLSGVEAGTHVVELQAEVTGRRAQAETRPSQLTVVLEPVVERLVSVTGVIETEPAEQFERDEPEFDVAEVLISGAATTVAQVVSAHVALDLAEQRGSFDSDVRLLPIDAEGNRVADLTLEPQTVHVTVNIRQRDDVREVPVRPDFVLDSLPEGYVLTSISYEPQNILIGVVSGQVDRIPDTLLTDPIDLTNRTGDFDLTVPVRLADDDLLVLGGQHITVSVRINALTSTRQFTNIRVDLIGLPTEIEAQLVPDEVTALITGPQPVLEKLIAADVQVLVDLNGLQAGRYEIAPDVVISQGQTAVDNISVLPAAVSVELFAKTDLPDLPSVR